MFCFEIICSRLTDVFYAKIIIFFAWIALLTILMILINHDIQGTCTFDPKKIAEDEKDFRKMMCGCFNCSYCQKCISKDYTDYPAKEDCLYCACFKLCSKCKFADTCLNAKFLFEEVIPEELKKEKERYSHATSYKYILALKDFPINLSDNLKNIRYYK